MSLGLPEFGSRGQAGEESGLLRVVRIAGFVTLAYAVAIAATEGMESYTVERALEKAAADAAGLAQSAEAARRSLLKSSELLVAASSVDSSPARVIADIGAILPDGVSVISYKIDYQGEAPARVDLGVVARAPEAYDRFLSALSKSPRFSDIRPGSESRPGLVRATVTVLHRPKGPAGS